MAKEPKDPKELKFPPMKISESAAYQLDDLDRQLLRYKIRFPNITHAKLAGIVGCKKSTVGVRLKKPAFQEALSDLQRSAAQLLDQAARDGARRLIKLVNSDDDKVALNAIRIALAPYMNKHEVEVKPVRKFSTDVSPDGSLIQRVIDAEVGDE